MGVCERVGWRVGCCLRHLPRPHEDKVSGDFLQLYSLQTGCDWVQSYFLNEGNSDETRGIILVFNRHLWQSIRPQVSERLKENWPRWVEEKPEWFNQVFISNVDDDLLPPEVLEQQNQIGGGSRRRSSVGDRMCGSVRRRSTAQVAPTANFPRA